MYGGEYRSRKSSTAGDGCGKCANDGNARKQACGQVIERCTRLRSGTSGQSIGLASDCLPGGLTCSSLNWRLASGVQYSRVQTSRRPSGQTHDLNIISGYGQPNLT